MALVPTNEAEYSALIEGLKQALALSCTEISVQGNSKTRCELGRRLMESEQVKPEVIERRSKGTFITFSVCKDRMDSTRKECKCCCKQHVEVILEYLPEKYTSEIYQKKCELVYEHMYESYFDSRQSTYEAMA